MVIDHHLSHGHNIHSLESIYVVDPRPRLSLRRTQRPWMAHSASVVWFWGVVLFVLYVLVYRLSLTTIVSNATRDADSVHYLPLAEATVFRFLVPLVTAYACSIFLSQPFTRKELTAGLVALLGVIIIAHPPWLFGEVFDTITPKKPSGIDHVTPTQRFIAIVMSILGVAGASGAYTTIRVIGNRAHALMSVNYFAFLATVSSAIALLIIPGIGFTLPTTAWDWTLLVLMGVFGFVLQFLLTAGLQLDKTSKATSMLYAQIIFALAFDFGIWGVIPGGWSLFGGAIVIASTLWSALQKTTVAVEKKGEPDEESALLGAQTEGIAEVARRVSIGA
jgi:drug/metabolite transporter (DMT)-like permease